MPVKPIKIKIFGIDLFSQGLGKAQKKLSTFGKSASAFGRTFSLAVSAPALLLGANILKTAGDFEASMNQVRALTGATGESFESLTAQARELGATTQFSAREAAGAQAFLAQAGFETNQILSAMPATLNLAAAGQLELAQTGDIVSNILTGYGKKAEETESITDRLAATFSSANTNLEQLGEAFKLAGPIASSMEIPFNDTATALGLMGNAGFQASLAGTSLRGAFTKLINPTSEAVKIFQKLSIPKKALIDSKGNLIGIRNTLEVLSKSGANTADILEIFGQRAGPAMAALLKQGLPEFDKLKKKIDGSASLNTATKIAQIQMEGFNGQMKALVSAFDELKIAIGESGVLKFATKFAKGLTSVLRKLAKSNPAILKFGAILLGLLAVAGPLIIGLGAVSAAIGAISLPVVAVIAGILSLGAAIAFLIIKWKMIMAWIKKIPTPILFLLGPLGLLIKATQLISDNWDTVVSIFKNALSVITKLAKAGKDLASSFVGKVAGFFGFDEEGQVAGKQKQAASTEESTVDNLFRRALNKLDSTLSKVEVSFRNAPDGTNIQTVQGGGNLQIENGLATAGN